LISVKVERINASAGRPATETGTTGGFNKIVTSEGDIGSAIL